MGRIPGVAVTPHHCMIQDKALDFYEQFHVLVLGLDSLEARRYMNSIACSFLGTVLLSWMLHRVYVSERERGRVWVPLKRPSHSLWLIIHSFIAFYCCCCRLQRWWNTGSIHDQTYHRWWYWRVQRPRSCHSAWSDTLLRLYALAIPTSNKIPIVHSGRDASISSTLYRICQDRSMAKRKAKRRVWCWQWRPYAMDLCKGAFPEVLNDRWCELMRHQYAFEALCCCITSFFCPPSAFDDDWRKCLSFPLPSDVLSLSHISLIISFT